MNSRRLFPLITVAAALCAGCRSTGSKLPPTLQPYPAAADRSTILDVQVVKHSTEIEFTNTSSHTFGPSTIWLNARFHRKIDSIAIGQTVILPLKEFTDEFGDPFRGGGFWASEDPEKLVLTQIETAAPDGKPQLIGLITIRSDE